MADSGCRLKGLINIEHIGEDIHERLLRIMVEEAPVGAFIISLDDGECDGRIIYANPEFCGMFGYSADECRAMPEPWEFIYPEDRKAIDDTFKKLPIGEKVNRQARGLRKDGSLTYIDVVATATIFEDTTSIVGMVRDVTKKKVLEKEKNNFFAMVTHDLKGPLTSIINSLELSKNENMDDETLKMLETAQHNAHKLNDMIDKFLLLSNFETGNAKIKPKLENISLILKGIEQDYYPIAKQNEIVFNAHIQEPPLLPHMEVDRRYFERAVSNLLAKCIQIYSRRRERNA